jgi:hypothetical protein
MAQQSYRANLSAAIYPMALSRAGRSVIIPGIDQNYDRRVDPTGEQKTPGIPQALYLENVVPTVEGYQSVGYITQQSVPANLGLALKLEIRDVNIGLVTLFFCEATNVVYAWYNGAWRTVTAPTAPTGAHLSYATIRGKTYIFDGVDLFEFQFNSPNFELIWKDDAAGTGAFLSPTGVLEGCRAIASSFGYMLLLKWDPLTGQETFLLWSSVLDETDFDPSLVTGAGGGAVAAAEGTPVHVIGTSKGFRIYCSNIIEATYTGNARYPFRLVPVNTDAPPTSWAAIYGQNDMDEHLYFTAHRNIQVATPGGVQALAPELTEFLERFISRQDSFNTATNTFSVIEDTGVANYNVQLFAYGSRYIFVSVGSFSSDQEDNSLFHTCYVFDRLLNRYGRLKIDHTHVFEGARLSSPEGVFRNDRTVYFVNFLTGTNKCWSLDKDPLAVHAGVLLLGKFQGARSRRIGLEELEVESALTVKTDCSVYLLPSENGKTFLPAITPYEPADSTAEVKKYLCHTDSKNICLLIKGGFDVSTVEMKFHLRGSS